jgi:lantibiotic biosynthesis protein
VTPRRAQSSARAAFFVLRSPLLSFDDLATWPGGLQASAVCSTDDTQLEAALATDRTCLRTRLAALVERPTVREALFLATPALDESLERWQRDPDGERGQRVERALIRYLERMAARATPFGLFAGCAVGTIGPRTSLQLPPGSAHRRHTRLDLHYLGTLIAALETDPAIRTVLHFRPSSSLYRLGDRWHWVQLTPDDPAHSHRRHHLDASPALNALLARAQPGATLAELRALADLDLDALVEQQLLVSDLQPAVTGPEPIHRLIDRLEELAPVAPLAALSAEVLSQTRDELSAIDAAGLGVEPARYRTLTTRLSGLPVRLDPARLFQTELIKTPTNEQEPPALSLGPEVLAEIERGVEILRRLHRPGRDSLTRLREALIARHEGLVAQRQLPLVEVLDPDAGLGFGPDLASHASTPLLAGLELPPESREQRVPWGDHQDILLQLLSAALCDGATEIVLSDTDLERLSTTDPQPLPDAFSATAVLAAESSDAVARGEFRLLMQGVAGPSGARLLGRFSHGDPLLKEQVQQHLRAEEALRLDAVFAEIVHLPEPRTGNIMHRPVLRDYEIVYLASGGVPLARQIPISDLFVSVDGERIVLHSARLGREVLPRLSCAQNYFHPRTTPLYRFLAALQDQAVASRLGWDWGPLANAPFLPRISTGRLVLARVQWRLSRSETTELASLRGAALFRVVQRWRRERRLPRYLRLADFDNELLVDLENILSLESFAHLLKGRDQAVLLEAFPSPDQLCVTSPEGRFFHELSIPFIQVRDESTARDDRQPTSRIDARDRSLQLPSEVPSLRRTFPPGSEWLYAKLYAPAPMIDRLLRQVVRPLVTQALASGAADGWFFIRYADPRWHLRLRLHGDPARLHQEVLPLILAAGRPLVTSGALQHLQLDTYERETERYGGPEGMLLSERLFMADSEVALELIDLFDDQALAEARWKLALLGMDLLLETLGLDTQRKLAVLQTVHQASVREHRADQKLLRQLGERYRAERVTLAELLDPARCPPDPLVPGVLALRRRSSRLASVFAELRQAAQNGRLMLSLEELAASYLHLQANRLLQSEHRLQELVLYDLLSRLYESQLAQTRRREPAPGPAQPQHV